MVIFMFHWPKFQPRKLSLFFIFFFLFSFNLLPLDLELVLQNSTHVANGSACPGVGRKIWLAKWKSTNGMESILPSVFTWVKWCNEKWNMFYSGAVLWVYMEVSTLSPWEDGCLSDEGSKLKCKGLALNSWLRNDWKTCLRWSPEPTEGEFVILLWFSFQPAPDMWYGFWSQQKS